MKRIYIYLLSAIVSLAFAPAVSAQTDYSIAGQIGNLVFQNTSDVYTVTNNVGVRKQVSTPVNGKYWIKLEAFATGEASVIVNSKPADILLVLDLSTSMLGDYNGTSRLAALKTAATAFVKSIYDNAVAASEADPNYVNRIGIVTFHGARSDGQGATDITNAWLDVKEKYATLTNNISSLNTSNSNPKGTHTHTGLYYAIENYLDNDGYDVSGAERSDKARDDASLTVVVFTDGEPAGGSATIGGQNQSTFNNYIANTAVNYAHELKTTHNATVFTVFVGTLSTQIEQFLNALSSNYPYANATFGSTTAWDGAVTYGEGTYNGGYYQDASSADLTSIFKTIAGQSGGSASAELTSSSATTVDIVSESFMLPSNAVASDIKVFTAKCNYADADTKTYRFDTEILAPNSTDTYRVYNTSTSFDVFDVDDALAEDGAVTVDNSTNKISVTGFDFSNNWCGPLIDGTSTTYQGHKLIILIPIEANPDAVGGPEVVTNTTGSGIYVNGEPLVAFEYPKISLPVNIYIEKAGLKNGESAKFIIEKAVMPASGNPADVAANGWSYVTSVFVTKPQTAASTDPDPIVKIKGLPATEIEGTGSSAVQKALLYRIREENWSWSYTFSTDPQYTSEKVENPFTFENKPKTNIDIRVRHAESKSTNIFKTGETGGHYDDSKTNVRP